MPRDGALAAQIRLQIRHQQRTGNSFSCNVTQHQPESILTQMQKVVIVSTDLVGLNAYTPIVECSQGRKALREQSGLYLFGNLQFMSQAPLRFELGCFGA